MSQGVEAVAVPSVSSRGRWWRVLVVVGVVAYPALLMRPWIHIALTVDGYVGLFYGGDLVRDTIEAGTLSLIPAALAAWGALRAPSLRDVLRWELGAAQLVVIAMCALAVPNETVATGIFGWLAPPALLSMAVVIGTSSIAVTIRDGRRSAQA